MIHQSRREELQTTLNELEQTKPKVLIIGDAMVDKYTYGEISRISPEVPVPILESMVTQYFLGGAAHVANIIKRLGGRPHLVYGVGYDDTGIQLTKMIRSAGIEKCVIFDVEDSVRVTTLKHRMFAGSHPLLRVDRETTDEWCDETTHEQIQTWIDRHHTPDDPFKAIVISDYDKGFITDEHYAVVKQLSIDHNIPLIVDPKYRWFFKYHNAWVITPNRKEVVAAFSDLSLDERKGSALMVEMYGYRVIVLTLGEDGIAVFQQDTEKVNTWDSDSQNCINVSGAGDTITAAFALVYALDGWHVKRSASFASFCAGIAVDRFPIHAVSIFDVQSRLEKKE